MKRKLNIENIHLFFKNDIFDYILISEHLRSVVSEKHK